MLWLGIYLPQLALEVFERTVDYNGSDARTSVALAVCDRLHVLLTNPGAQALGVRNGIKRATALALAPDLRMLERDPTREQQALEQIACWLLQFTPSISLIAPAASAGKAARHRVRASLPNSGLLLEVEPSLRLFGGLDALWNRIKSGLHTLGFSAQLACAPTARGAWLLSLQSDGVIAQDQAQLNARLAALPLCLLDSAAPHRDTFESIGTRTIKELQLLPRAGLARRFGHELLHELDQALGKKADPRAWFEAPPSYSARLELLADIENAEALLFAAQRLLIEMTGWLSALHVAVRSFELHGIHDDLPATQLPIRMTEASRDLERMVGLLRERLAVTKLPAPVHTLILICGEVVPLSLPNQELFPTPRSTQESLGRLIERLQTRLGRQQIQRLCVLQDHRPEAAYRLEEIDQAFEISSPVAALATSASTSNTSTSNTSDSIALSSHSSLPRPLWLLRTPVPISERNNRPYWGSSLNLLAGPERIESGWWDGALVQRDYFIAEDDANVLYWIYRERLGSTDPGKGWFLQGRFG
jgi:protein ImuB